VGKLDRIKKNISTKIAILLTIRFIFLIRLDMLLEIAEEKEAKLAALLVSTLEESSLAQWDLLDKMFKDTKVEFEKEKISSS